MAILYEAIKFMMDYLTTGAIVYGFLVWWWSDKSGKPVEPLNTGAGALAAIWPITVTWIIVNLLWILLTTITIPAIAKRFRRE